MLDETKWDDPESDFEDRDLTEEEMAAIESGEFFDTEGLEDLVFGESPVGGFDKNAAPKGWDITDLMDWEDGTV